MKMEDILTFITIIDQKGILKAADQLFVSQSTVSNRLSSLEEELGVKLIDRSPGQKNFSLTKRGEEFLSFAREYQYLNTSVREWATQTPTQRLRIGTIDSFSSTLFKGFFRSAVDKKGFFLEVSHHWTDRIFELLENHYLDVGIVPRLLNSKNIETIPILSEKMVLVSFSKIAPMVHPADLDPSKEIYFDWGNAYITWHSTWFDPSKRPKAIVDITSALFEVLKIEGTWAIVPMSVANEYSGYHSFYTAELSQAPPERVGFFVSRPNLHVQKSKAIEELKGLLRDYLKEQESIHVMDF